MQARLFAALVSLLVLAAGCGSMERDPRGTFTMLGDCARDSHLGAWSHCSARMRPWGDRMEP